MPTGLTAFWQSLSDASQPRARYLGRALLADLPITVAVGFAITRLTGLPSPDLPADSLPRALLALCVIAPIIETFGLAVVIWILRRVMPRPAYVPWVAALVCAGLHSLRAPWWGLEVFWSFVIFALCYLAWERKSVLQAFWMTVILHALHNLVPTLALLVARI